MWTLTIGETMPRSFTVKWKALIFVIASLQVFVESVPYNQSTSGNSVANQLLQRNQFATKVESKSKSSHQSILNPDL